MRQSFSVFGKNVRSTFDLRVWHTHIPTHCAMKVSEIGPKIEKKEYENKCHTQLNTHTHTHTRAKQSNGVLVFMLILFFSLTQSFLMNESNSMCESFVNSKPFDKECWCSLTKPDWIVLSGVNDILSDRLSNDFPELKDKKSCQSFLRCHAKEIHFTFI